MTARSSARLLAPAALVVTAFALFAVVSSGGGESADRGDAATPAATATATAERERKRDKEDAEPSGETYTVEPGDTPLAIAEKTGVDVDALLEANPGLDANALTVGEELQLP